MKGLNVKRIAAIGLGAALVGSALAPAVMAAAYSNLETLQKSNIVDSTGTPVVDILVGSMGQAADVVWAGNIAAKVAQLATVDVAGSGTKTVDFTVGGTATTTGAGLTEKTASVNLIKGANTEFTGMSVTSVKMPTLVNDTGAEWKVADVDTQVDLEETLTATGIDAYAQANYSSTAYAFGEVVASIPAGALKYKTEFSTALSLGTGLDENSDFDISIPFLGKNYVVDEVSASKIIMYSDTLPTEMKTSEKLTVTPTAAYAGKTVEIQLVDLVSTGNTTNTTYKAKWAVLVDGVAKDYYEAAPTTAYDLKDVFDKDYFTDSITVTAAGRNEAAGTYTATIRTGSDRLEIRDGEAFPFANDNTIDDAAAWEADIAADLKSITIQNKWAYTKDSGSETKTSKYVLKVGETVSLPNNFAKFTFVGFQDKPTHDVVVGADSLDFTDSDGKAMAIPYYQQFELDADENIAYNSTLDYTFYVPHTDLNVVYARKGDYSTTPPSSPYTNWTAGRSDLNQLVNSMAPFSLDLDSTADVNYLFLYKGGSNTQAAVVLDAQTFEVYTDGADKAYMALADTNGARNYYLPNYEDFSEAFAFGYVDDTYIDVNFVYTSLNGAKVEMIMESGESAKVWDYEALQDMTDVVINGPSFDARVGTFELSENKADLKALATGDGSVVAKDADTFVVTVPEEVAELEAYLGSSDTTTGTTGGAPYAGVKAGETKGNVTVTAIGGATAGKAIVKVGNIVKLDTDTANGKSIIVGGQMVNQVAKTILVNGMTLDKSLISAGDYVAAVLADGKIVVAGWTAGDTGTAARALIAAMDAFM